MKTALNWLIPAVLLAVPPLRAAAPPPASAPHFEQKIGQQLPLSVEFHDTEGHSHALGDFFRGRPVVLFFGYARCPQLCSLVGEGTAAALRRLPRTAGRDFEVLSISIDPQESETEARGREQQLLGWYDRKGADDGWHYLTGTAAAIKAVTAAAGFHYYYDAAARLYVHPSGFLIATPDGVVSRYFFGVDFASADVATALARAARGETGHSVYELLLICCRGDWIGGRYGPLIWRVLWASVLLTVVGMAGGIGWMLWQERRAGRSRTAEDAS